MAEASEEGLGSQWAVVPMMMMMMIAQLCFLFSCLAPMSPTNYPPTLQASNISFYTTCMFHTNQSSIHPSMDPSRILLYGVKYYSSDVSFKDFRYLKIRVGTFCLR
jgi:hypothetical protein